MPNRWTVPLDVSISVSSAWAGPLLGLSLFLLAVVLQYAALRWLDPQTLVGDESDYLAMASGKPGSALWVRVPLGAAPLWIARQIGAGEVLWTSRLIMALIAAAVVGLGAWYACEQAGLPAGVTAGFVLMLSAERAVLALHLWPDTLMGLCLMLFAVAISAPASDGVMLWIGVLAAVGFLIRVDFAVLAVFATVNALLEVPFSGVWVACAALPTLLAAAGLTLYNKRKHGIWAADTTFQFNLEVAATEADFPQAVTGELMQRTIRRVRARDATAKASAKAIFTAPILAFRRLVTLLGQETFVLQKLTTAQPAIYVANLSSVGARLGQATIRVWFSAVFIAFVYFSPAIPPEILWLVASVVFVQSAVQTRSRYRLSVFPVLAVWVAIAAGSGEATTASAAVLALVVAVVLAVFRPRPEA